MQAGVVAAPRLLAARGNARLGRLRGRGWALLPAASIIVVIFLVRLSTASADWLTELALVAVPVLAALALGWFARGARPWLAPLAGALFVVAWQTPGSLAGEAAAALLCGLSCVALGVLIASVTPSGWLKLGIVLLALADIWLIASSLLQQPNDVLSAARPGAGLPQLQSEQFGSVTMGYGDLFAAALLGAAFAARAQLQRRAALLTFALAALFDLLFFVVDELPATVPVAAALVVMQLFTRRRTAAGESAAGRVRALALSAWRGRLRRGAGTPPPAR